MLLLLFVFAKIPVLLRRPGAARIIGSAVIEIFSYRNMML